jgi:hypothetical protein
MLLRVLLIIVLVIFAVRALARLLNGVVEGVVGRPASGPPKGVEMARDPVCGTFVVPGRALMLSDGRQQLYFCSAKCRDAYQSRTA